MGGDLATAVAAALDVLASEPDPLAAVYVRGNLLVRPIRVRESAERRRPSPSNGRAHPSRWSTPTGCACGWRKSPTST